MTTTSPFIDASEAPARYSGQIKLHGPESFAGMRKAGKLAAECLDMLIPHVVPGVMTSTLDDLAREFVLAGGGIPACLFYKGYRHTVCTSVNHVVCHGIPGAKALKDGDVVNIDVTVIVDGWHGDTSRMYSVGGVKRKAMRLMDVTYESMMRGIEAIKLAQEHVGELLVGFAVAEGLLQLTRLPRCMLLAQHLQGSLEHMREFPAFPEVPGNQGIGSLHQDVIIEFADEIAVERLVAAAVFDARGDVEIQRLENGEELRRRNGCGHRDLRRRVFQKHSGEPPGPPIRIFISGVSSPYCQNVFDQRRRRLRRWSCRTWRRCSPWGCSSPARRAKWP